MENGHKKQKTYMDGLIEGHVEADKYKKQGISLALALMFVSGGFIAMTLALFTKAETEIVSPTYDLYAWEYVTQCIQGGNGPVYCLNSLNQ